MSLSGRYMETHGHTDRAPGHRAQIRRQVQVWVTKYNKGQITRCLQDRSSRTRSGMKMHRLRLPSAMKSVCGCFEFSPFPRPAFSPSFKCSCAFCYCSLKMSQRVQWKYLSPKRDSREAWPQPWKRGVLTRFKAEVGTNGEPEPSLAFYCLKLKVLINACIRGHIRNVLLLTPVPDL